MRKYGWTTRWTTIEGVRGYFNKITEELVDPARLLDASNPFLRRIGEVYQKDFTIQKPSEPKICKECDLHRYCYSEGVIRLREDER